MADQIMMESKAPKPRLLRRIGWWIWVVLLTALLVLGFVFAAPWKVITLITIFLIAATILPRIYRKWFWGAVGLVVLAIIVWIFLPDDNKDWKPYQFDKELAQLQAKYAVPDSENAAIAYNKILADWKQKEANEPNLSHDKFDFARHNLWLTKDQPEVAAYMKYYHNTIEKVLQATSIQKYSFPVATSYIDFSQTHRSSAMRRWSYLLIAAGNNNAADGNTNEAVEKYLAAIRLGQHEYQQPEYIDTLVGMACEALGFGGINNLVVWGDANEFYLDKLAEAVSAIKHDWNSDFQDLITLDKLKLKNEFSGFLYEVNSKGKIRLNGDQSAMMREQFKTQLDEGTIDDPEIKAGLQKVIISPGYWLKKLMKTHTILIWFYAPTTPEKLGEITDASFERYYAMTKPDFDWSKEPNIVPIQSLFQLKFNFRQLIILLTKMNEQIYFSSHDLYLRNATQQRGTLLIIAIRRYKNANGHWPESLDEVKTLAPAEIFVDPMNNDSFVYKLTDDGFTLYGKGKNGVDEEGKYENNWPAKSGADDLRIWPYKSKVSKQQEQKTEK